MFATGELTTNERLRRLEELAEIVIEPVIRLGTRRPGYSEPPRLGCLIEKKDKSFLFLRSSDSCMEDSIFIESYEIVSDWDGRLRTTLATIKLSDDRLFRPCLAFGDREKKINVSRQLEIGDRGEISSSMDWAENGMAIVALSEAKRTITLEGTCPLALGRKLRPYDPEVELSSPFRGSVSITKEKRRVRLEGYIAETFAGSIVSLIARKPMPRTWKGSEGERDSLSSPEYADFAVMSYHNLNKEISLLCTNDPHDLGGA